MSKLTGGSDAVFPPATHRSPSDVTNKNIRGEKENECKAQKNKMNSLAIIFFYFY